MRNLFTDLESRAATLLTAGGVAAVAIAEYVVEDPRTAHVLEQLVPYPWTQLVPVAFAGLTVYRVQHKLRNRPQKAAAPAPAVPAPVAATPEPVVPVPAPVAAPVAVPAPSLADMVRATPASSSSSGAPTSVVQLVGLPGGR